MEVICDVEIEDETIDYKSLNPKNILNTLQNLKGNYKVVLILNLTESYDKEEILAIILI